MLGRDPPLYYTLTLIAIPGHEKQQKQKTIQYINKKVVIIYGYNAIEPYNSRGLGKTKNVGEKPIVKLYIQINHHAGTPKHNNYKRRDRLGVYCSLLTFTVYEEDRKESGE